MIDTVRKFFKTGLTSNQLKMLAVIFMTADHLAKGVFRQNMILLILGRLAFPIFAFFIAEGCTKTRSILRYLSRVGILALTCQAVFSLYMKNYTMCILVTFTLSIFVIYFLDKAMKKKSPITILLCVIAIVVTGFLCIGMKYFIQGFTVDYGMIGAVTPPVLYIFKTKNMRIYALILMMLSMSILFGGLQYISLASVLLLGLYNGERGKYKLKYFFYLYYPLHLVVIYLLSLVIVQN